MKKKREKREYYVSMMSEYQGDNGPFLLRSNLNQLLEQDSFHKKALCFDYEDWNKNKAFLKEFALFILNIACNPNKIQKVMINFNIFPKMEDLNFDNVKVIYSICISKMGDGWKIELPHYVDGTSELDLLTH